MAIFGNVPPQTVKAIPTPRHNTRHVPNLQGLFVVAAEKRQEAVSWLTHTCATQEDTLGAVGGNF